jgi:hypothetical protein
MTGKFNLNDLDGKITTWNSTTDTVDFDTTSENFKAESATGSFSGLNGVNGTMYDFNYSLLPSNALLFAIGSFEFYLDQSISILSELAPDFLSISGYGTMKDTAVAGYDDTVVKFTFNITPEGVGTWSGSAVPAPGIALLLGLGLVAVGVSRKVRKA